MSKIQGKPFIEKLIDDAGLDSQNELLSKINGGSVVPTFRSLINPDYYIDPEGGDEYAVYYTILETQDKNYTGYLLCTRHYYGFIAFNENTQDLTLLDIDLDTQTYKTINEPLTIAELRSVLNDFLIEAGENVTVQSDDIDSEGATAGQVLTANGSGRTIWTEVIHYITKEIGPDDVSFNVTADEYSEANQSDNCILIVNVVDEEDSRNNKTYYLRKTSVHNKTMIFEGDGKVSQIYDRRPVHIRGTFDDAEPIMAKIVEVAIVTGTTEYDLSSYKGKVVLLKPTYNETTVSDSLGFILPSGIVGYAFSDITNEFAIDVVNPINEVYIQSLVVTGCDILEDSDYFGVFDFTTPVAKICFGYRSL